MKVGDSKILDKKLKLKASGKINLYLNVKKNGRDDGYHEIKSIMQSVSLSDELCFEVNTRNTGDRKHCENENGISITSNNIDIPLDEKNLVHKAALLMLESFNLKEKYSVAINIIKYIPVCAGLAGGSTNAAATLVALDKLFDLNLGTDSLLELASKIGSDVPFCINGGTALAEGRGEKITKLPDLPFYWVVLANNDKKFLTRDVYKKFDLVGKEKKSIHMNLTNNIAEKKFKDFFKGLENDLESVTAGEDRMVSLIKQKALALGAFPVQMTGSGPTVFAFCPDLEVARRVCGGLDTIANETFLSHTVSNGLSFV
jgi:4-diphosphocytidyl-2-C-methyl-D-erythritol kinase